MPAARRRLIPAGCRCTADAFGYHIGDRPNQTIILTAGQETYILFRHLLGYPTWASFGRASCARNPLWLVPMVPNPDRAGSIGKHLSLWVPFRSFIDIDEYFAGTVP
jgi:hypothetical protein